MGELLSLDDVSGVVSPQQRRLAGAWEAQEHSGRIHWRANAPSDPERHPAHLPQPASLPLTCVVKRRRFRKCLNAASQSTELATTQT
jgi:hypothetical protein